MLLALLIWAYACGVTSSRRIEAACRQDVAFRVICAGDVPDHVTVARFRRDFPDLEAVLAGDAEREAATGDAPPRMRNITDPDSRLMPVRGGGFIQGYNAQNVVTEDGLVIATRLTNDTTDYSWYEPMITGAAAAAAMMAAHRPPSPAGGPEPGKTGLVLADAGYCSAHNLTCPSPGRTCLAVQGRTRAGGRPRLRPRHRGPVLAPPRPR